jgi:hypothetical protein
MIAQRTVFTGTPNDIALMSPNAKASRMWHKAIPTTSAGTVATTSVIVDPHLSPAKDPRVHDRAERAAFDSPKIMIITDTAAPHNWPTATPAKIVRPAGNSPDLPVAIVSTMTKATTAPMKEARVIRTDCPRVLEIPTIRTKTAPTDAPLEIPSRYGSARSLPVKVCNTAPHIANKAPTAIDPMTRGALICHTIWSLRTVTSAPSMSRKRRATTRATSETGTRTAPIPRTTRALPIRAATTMPSRSQLRQRLTSR